MQYVDRSSVPVPAALARPEYQQSREEMAELLRGSSEKRAQSRVKMSADLLGDMELEGETKRLFCGRCAFCEAEDKLFLYRFRPVSNAQPNFKQDFNHLYYSWLSHAWENIYPICSACYPSDPDYFPVKGPRAPLPNAAMLRRYVASGDGRWGEAIDEQPLLLDPCQPIVFHKHLRLLRNGEMIGVTKAGRITIDFFSLDRRALQRQKAFIAYFEEFLGDFRKNELQRLLENPDANVPNWANFSELEFGGTWYLLMRRLAVEVHGRQATATKLQRSQIWKLLGNPLNRKNDETGFREAWELLRIKDEQETQAAAGRGAGGRQGGANRSTPEARLRSVSISNFKAIEKLELEIPLSKDDVGNVNKPVPSLLILGENAAGKSSILEGVALVLATKRDRDTLKLNPEDCILKPGLMGGGTKDERAEANIVAYMDQNRVRKLKIDRRYRKIDLENGSDDIGPPVFAYGAFRHYRESIRGKQSTIQSLFYADPLRNPQEWLLSLEDNDFNEVIRTLRGILSADGSFEVVKRGNGRCMVVTAVTALDGKVAYSETPIDAVSSGYRSVLAMVCDIMRGLMSPRPGHTRVPFEKARGVVLIDEVEVHLHPRWKMQIMRSLREAFPNMTFIATTHDPLCLRGMDEGQVVVLQRVARERAQGSELPVMVEQLKRLPNITQLRVDQLLTSDLFQLFSTDAPEIDSKFARVADILAAEAKGKPLSEADEKILKEFQNDISLALPIGSSEAHRLVQQAVAEYLAERRDACAARMKELSDKAKAEILRVLRGTSDAPR